MAEDIITLEGTVEEIIYRNDDNGYAVCELNIDDKLVTVTGTLPFIGEGEMVKVLGQWTNHPNYGRQFKAETFEKCLPASGEAILKYLSSRAIKGIGPTTAQRIVDQFGADTFNVIENYPDYLSQIKGITRKKAIEISEEFKAQYGMRSVMLFCNEYFPPATALRIFKRWGVASVERIRSNPYILCENINGIGFEKADEVAINLGVGRDNSERICAGLKYILDHNMNSNGHTFIPLSKLLPAASSLLKVDSAVISAELVKQTALGQLVQINLRGHEVIYTYQSYKAEHSSANKLIEIDRAGRRTVKASEAEVMQIIADLEQADGISYAEQQRKAILYACTNGVMLLTGGPGTGKTTIIKAVLRIFEQLGLKVLLAAPTGRAAKRMSQATSQEAKTIHRLLEISFTENDTAVFTRNSENPLEADVVIIDEASMVDIYLLGSLLQAIRVGTKLVMIGDVDQLPSVGPGNVLDDLLTSEVFPTVRLNEIFRQAQQSTIIVNAHLINSGEMPLLENRRENDFFFIKRSSSEAIAAAVEELIKTKLPASYGADVADRIQVITPTKKGVAGTVSLNRRLQAALNGKTKGKKEKLVADTSYRVGDKIMQIKNNYMQEWTAKDGTDGLGVFNGDIGYIIDIDTEESVIEISYEDRIARYDFAQLDELVHSFAVTVHKSQGSEYPIIIIPLPDEMPRLMTRNLLYTAVTRAQTMVIIVGREDTIRMMVENNRQTMRFTGLRDALQANYGLGRD